MREIEPLFDAGSLAILFLFSLNYRSDDQRFFFGPTTDTTSVTNKETHRSTELTATATLSLTNVTENTPPDTDRKTSIVTRSIKIEKPTGLRSNEKSAKPSKKLKVRITFDGQSPLEAGHSKEVRNTPVSLSGDVKKANVGALVVKPVRQLRVRMIKAHPTWGKVQK
ncbi:hypothetical protein CTI12_AA078860 [Artemisia annua]|uniref:Uncharacterized protein n=1 Tax=Artemisia annua TaxID=35608 RepID=A0A2U1Q3I8_ARTAN|nr:hypothetical protein CTI12_AA078860 [Artemisia annua]